MASRSQASTPGATQNPPVDPSDPSLPESDSDSDSGSDSGAVLNQLAIWDWMVKEADFEDIHDTEPLSIAQDRRVKSAKRVPKQSQGEWEWIEYFPEWTDPDYDPEYEVWDKIGAMRKRRKRDVTQVVRPALLLQDQLKNPTMHALRWGLHPDGTLGRSFTTPTVAIGTRVDMPGEGLKSASDFLKATVQDNAHPEGMSLRDYIETQTGARDKMSADEKAQAWLKLYDVISDNQDYQRYLFDGYTTDDFVEQRIYDPANLTIPDSDLQGPLHPLVVREKWLTTEHLGGGERVPRQLFNINGYRGEYSAWDDTIWAAMQPALQMVSRVLNANHPYWLALLDIYSRAPIHPSRDSRPLGARTAVPLRNSLKMNLDPAFMWHEAKALRALNYPSMRVTAKVLLSRIQWEFGSVFRNFGEDKKENATLGLTSYDPTYPAVPPIRIQLGLELIFPLLVRSYSAGEKAVCSFIVAAVMLHELAHACHYAHSQQLSGDNKWVKIDPAFEKFDPRVYAHLSNLGKQISDPWSFADECFFENEVKAEMGCAFEDKLFGGVIETMPASQFKDLQMQTVVAIKQKWPHAAPNPHPKALEGSETFIISPAAHAMDVEEAVPVDLCARFFSNDFWSHDVAKFGWQTFKMTSEQPLKSRTSHWFPANFDKRKLYGNPSVADWIGIARTSLYEAGHWIIADYLSALSWEGLDNAMVRRIWAYERNTWDHTDQQLSVLADKVKAMAPGITQKLAFLHGPQEQIESQFEHETRHWTAQRLTGQNVSNPRPTRASFLERRLFEIWTLMRKFFQMIDEIHRHLVAEVPYLQTLVYDYLTSDAPQRAAIWQAFGKGLASRMHTIHIRLATGSDAILGNMERHVTPLLQLNNQWPSKISGAIQKYRRLFTLDHNHLMCIVQYLHPQYLSGNIAPPVFAGVLPGQKKRKSQILRNMAIREMSLIKEPVLKEVIEMWYKVIQKRDELASETAGMEVTTLRNNIAKSVEGLKNALASQGISLSKYIKRGEPKPSKLGTRIFDVPKKPPSTSQGGQTQTQAPVSGQEPQTPVTEQQTQTESGNSPKRVKLDEFPETPAPAQWVQQAAALFPTQGGAFAQFANLPGFSAGGPQQGLFASTPQTWEASQPIGGGNAAHGFTPFPHPYATRETTTHDVELERQSGKFTNYIFGGQSLQAQFQHGTPAAFQTYREQRAESVSPKPDP